MAIFDLILNQTLDLEDVKDYLTQYEPMFEEMGADPKNYDWEMFDIRDIQKLELVRCLTLGNLIYAAQDVEIFPTSLDAEDFDFSCGISFDISSYDEREEILAGLQKFTEITGLEITV